MKSRLGRWIEQGWTESRTLDGTLDRAVELSASAANPD